MSYDYQIETKLIREAPELHRIFSNNVLCTQNMLNKYKAIFPAYTDHTALHSLKVISFCNELIGENIGLLNADEIFVLLMSAYLHDSGMGICERDYEQFSAALPCVIQYKKEHPDSLMMDIIRTNHHEFSGKYIEKYAMVFDMPSKEHLFAVIQSSRGHRKTDLFDEKEYPAEISLENGNVIHLPYITALIRLADEIDIAADRNIQFLYDISSLTREHDIKEFKKHLAIKRLEFEPESLVAYVDFSDPMITDDLHDLLKKLNATLKLCQNVIEQRTPFVLYQKELKVVEL